MLDVVVIVGYLSGECFVGCIVLCDVFVVLFGYVLIWLL